MFSNLPFWNHEFVLTYLPYFGESSGGKKSSFREMDPRYSYNYKCLWFVRSYNGGRMSQHCWLICALLFILEQVSTDMLNWAHLHKDHAYNVQWFDTAVCTKHNGTTFLTTTKPVLRDHSFGGLVFSGSSIHVLKLNTPPIGDHLVCSDVLWKKNYGPVGTLGGSIFALRRFYVPKSKLKLG